MEHDPESIKRRLERLEQSLRSRSSFTSPQTRINTPSFSREYLHGLFDDGLKSSESHAPTSVASKKSIDASRKQSEYIDRVKDPIAISPMPMSPTSRSSKLAERLCIESFTHRLVAGDRFNNLRWTGLELKDLLKEFACRLHEETTLPSIWELSTAMYRDSDTIAAVCTDTVDIASISHSHMSLNGVFGLLVRQKHKQNDNFVHGSEAYRWLISKLHRHNVPSAALPDAMYKIKDNIVGSLPGGALFKQLRRQRQMPFIEITFELNWDPKAYINHLGLFPPSPDIWEHILCLTGSWDAAQALTVAEYVHQTWPATGDRLLTFLYELLRAPEGTQVWGMATRVHATFFCLHYVEKAPMPNKSRMGGSILLGEHMVVLRVLGHRYLITDVAEQMAWLAVTLRLPSQKDRLGGVRPRIDRLSVDLLSEDGDEMLGSCRISFHDMPAIETPNDTSGFCWIRLFTNSTLVCGYPVPGRAVHHRGLELSLKAMACLVRSTQIVQYEDRLMMKGFNLLLIATSTESGVVLWHAIVNSQADERISYFDTRASGLKISHKDVPTLRGLETARHIIGWCSEAEDLCGHPQTALNVSASSLPHPPSSTYIDRLYVEAGLYFIAGMNLHVNQKEQQTQLGKATDYPSRLKWVGTQFLAFYDASARRAWLVDGASALLHLVRISLHLDETDPESVYDWKYEKGKMKEDWTGSTGRQAAQNTLKDWSNYDLPVYVKGRKNGIPQYSTFGERVEKILRDLEILFDVQAFLASPNGIKVPQELDSHKGISGFDVSDLLSPPGPIARRIARFDSRGNGWYDLLPAIGVVTIFGNDFGQLIRPDNPVRVCPEWRSIPEGQDYLVSTVSTLIHLYDKRFNGQYPITSTISWRSPNNQSNICACIGNEHLSTQKHHDPANFIVSNSLLQKRKLKDSYPVDVKSLNPKGAVVFANLSLTGQRIWTKNVDTGKLKIQDTASSASNSTTAGSSNPLDSMTSSTITHSAASTDATELSNNTTESTSAAAAPPGLGKGKGKRDKMKHFFGSLTKR